MEYAIYRPVFLCPKCGAALYQRPTYVTDVIEVRCPMEKCVEYANLWHKLQLPRIEAIQNANN